MTDALIELMLGKGRKWSHTIGIGDKGTNNRIEMPSLRLRVIHESSEFGEVVIETLRRNGDWVRKKKVPIGGSSYLTLETTPPGTCVKVIHKGPDRR